MSLPVHGSRLQVSLLGAGFKLGSLKNETKKDNGYHTVQNSNYLYFQKEKKVTSYFETSSL